MKKEDCFELGYITKTHGLTGEVTAFLDVDFPEDYHEIKAVFLEINKQLVPYFVEHISPTRESFVLLKLEDINSQQEGNDLKGKKLFLSLKELPELEEQQYYYHELVGFNIKDENLGTLGTAKNVYAGATQDLLVMEYKTKEILIPITDDIITLVDKEKGVIYTTLPNGLLEVYLEED